jgi:plasmid stabilization system protein ParE
MKYKTYLLQFDGDPEVVAFLERKVERKFRSLAEARRAGRAARELFGVGYEAVSVTRPRPDAGRVKPI